MSHGNIHRVLITADTLGGVWTYALDLAAGLQGDGVSVALATMGHPLSASQHEEVAKLSHVTLFESDFRLEWMEDPGQDLERAGAWLLEIEQQFAPDVVHLNQFAFGALPWQAPVLLVAHSCVYSWYEAVRGEAPPPRSWSRYRQIVRRGLRSADLVTAPTASLLESLRRHYGGFQAAPPIPNGRPPVPGPPAPGEPIILAAGRLWDESKNIQSLAAAAPRLPWPVYLAGETRHPNGHSVQFSGVRHLGLLPPRQLAHWMRRASIYALPARYEPFGLTILEAALSNCALVLGDIPSLRESWNGAALFVAPDDDLALRRALSSLIEAPSRRRKLAARARQRAARFSSEVMTRSYRDLYIQLLADRCPATVVSPAGPARRISLPG